MRISKTMIALTAVADIVVTLIAAPAIARAPAGPQQVRVSYADLDLSRTADRRVLRGRLDGAASRLCAGEQGLSAAMVCRRDVLSDIVMPAATAVADAR